MEPLIHLRPLKHLKSIIQSSCSITLNEPTNSHYYNLLQGDFSGFSQFGSSWYLLNLFLTNDIMYIRAIFFTWNAIHTISAYKSYTPFQIYFNYYPVCKFFINSTNTIRYYRKVLIPPCICIYYIFYIHLLVLYGLHSSTDPTDSSKGKRKSGNMSSMCWHNSVKNSITRDTRLPQSEEHTTLSLSMLDVEITLIKLKKKKNHDIGYSYYDKI